MAEAPQLVERGVRRRIHPEMADLGIHDGAGRVGRVAHDGPHFTADGRTQILEDHVADVVVKEAEDDGRLGGPQLSQPSCPAGPIGAKNHLRRDFGTQSSEERNGDVFGLVVEELDELISGEKLDLRSRILRMAADEIFRENIHGSWILTRHGGPPWDRPRFDDPPWLRPPMSIRPSTALRVRGRCRAGVVARSGPFGVSVPSCGHSGGGSLPGAPRSRRPPGVASNSNHARWSRTAESGAAEGIRVTCADIRLPTRARGSLVASAFRWMTPMSRWSSSTT